MAITVNGNGTITGISAGGLPDDVITVADLANSINTSIAANTAKTGITSAQTSAITANTAKTGITSSQATAITAALPKAGGTMTGNIAHAGDFTIDAGGDITLDADGADIKLKDAGTLFGSLVNASGDFKIVTEVADKDLIFRGNDGGSFITALTLDMSDAGFATFNNGITVGGNCFVPDNFKINLGTGNDLQIYHDGNNSYVKDAGDGDLYLMGSAEVLIRSAANANMIKCVTGAQVNLYYDNAVKLATSSTGVTVNGAIAGATNLGKITKVTMAYNSSTRSAFSYSRDLFARNNEMVGWKVGFSFVKESASTDIMVVFCMQVAKMRDCYQCATYSGTNYNSTFFKRFAFSGSISIGDNSVTQGMTITGTAIYPASELNSTGNKQFYWAMGRPNDGYNSSYILNPNTTEDAMYGGATTSTITVYEGDFT